VSAIGIMPVVTGVYEVDAVLTTADLRQVSRQTKTIDVNAAMVPLDLEFTNL